MKKLLCSNCNRNTCLSTVPIFQNLTEEESKAVAALVQAKSYQKGDPIFLAGDTTKALFVVKKGKVKITQTSESGREQVVRIIEVGDFFGEMALFDDKPLTSNAEAIMQTELCVLEGSALRGILEKAPQLMLAMLAQLSRRLEKAEILLGQLSNQDVTHRLATYILEHVGSENGYVFECPVNKTDLASMLGVSRETLSRKLSVFQKEGWIEITGRKIKVCQPEALKKQL